MNQAFHQPRQWPARANRSYPISTRHRLTREYMRRATAPDGAEKIITSPHSKPKWMRRPAASLPTAISHFRRIRVIRGALWAIRGSLARGRAAAVAAPINKPLITLIYADGDDGPPNFSEKIIASPHSKPKRVQRSAACFANCQCPFPRYPRSSASSAVGAIWSWPPAPADTGQGIIEWRNWRYWSQTQPTGETCSYTACRQRWVHGLRPPMEGYKINR